MSVTFSIKSFKDSLFFPDQIPLSITSPFVDWLLLVYSLPILLEPCVRQSPNVHHFEMPLCFTCKGSTLWDAGILSPIFQLGHTFSGT